MSTLLKLGTAVSRPGQKKWGQLPIREGKKKVSLPVCVVHGAKPGPHVVVTANQHGQEVNGIEAARRFFLEVDPESVRGTIFAIPSMNPHATLARKQVWTEGDPDQPLPDHYGNPYNMNWCWLRKPGGLLVHAITNEVWHQAICSTQRKASLVIDLHCHEGKSAIYVSNANDPREMTVALASGLQYLYLKGGDGDVATLYEACKREGITDTTVELHLQHRFNLTSIAEGVRLIRNMLRVWGVLDGKPELLCKVLAMDPWSTVDSKRGGPGKSYVMINARCDGLVVPYRLPLVRVRKGELISEVIDPQSAKVLQSVRAPVTGLLQQAHEFNVVVKKGDRLALFPLKPRTLNPAREIRRLASKLGEIQ